jgi:hypothetical protein
MGIEQWHDIFQLACIIEVTCLSQLLDHHLRSELELGIRESLLKECLL